jgi:hypothetical protein
VVGHGGRGLQDRFTVGKAAPHGIPQMRQSAASTA